MIHHFYHIYADGKWLEPVSEHVRALKMGLLDHLTTFQIGLVGSEQNCNDVKNWLNEQGVKYGVCAESRSGWEQVTQIPMWEFCQSNDGVVLYAHSKGASSQAEVNVRWRRSMIYWNVIRWRDSVTKLQDHETSGCHWIYPLLSMPEHKRGNPMYAGTFWWARCELVRTFMRPPLTHRHEAEGWIGYKYVEKPWKLWDWTPYFPNSNEFADGWISNENFKPQELGESK